MIKILNAYSGIGGNRRLWADNEINVTAIENNPEIAKIYQDFFPNDKVIITDAHEYILKHYKEFDFIWSSPPCQTHTRLRQLLNRYNQYKTKYPDMNLYQEILFLQTFYKGKYCIENVISYYKPLIIPQKISNHYFWTNFYILEKKTNLRYIKREKKLKTHIKYKEKQFGINLNEKLKGQKGVQALNNCVDPKLGLHVFNCAFNPKQINFEGLY